MNFERLEYIKSISHPDGIWAYPDYCKGTYFPLNFQQGVGIEAHASNLSKGALVILSQNYQGTRYLSHVVEIANESSEDEPQWENSEWGIVRWVKVIWAAEPGKAPKDKETLKVNWGYQNTKAKALNGDNLMKHWQTIDALRSQVSKALGEADWDGERLAFSIFK